MKNAISKKTINGLLKPLGLHIEQSDCAYRIVMTSLNLCCIVKTIHGVQYYATMPKLLGLVDIMRLISQATCFYVPSMTNQNGISQISNPYFGCKSVEEALIKKDLIA